MDKGFTQLAVQLIAIDAMMSEDKNTLLYGAVTMGDLWRFCVLDRKNKTIIKGIDAFLIPTDLEKLFAIFFGILNPSFKHK